MGRSKILFLKDMRCSDHSKRGKRPSCSICKDCTPHEACPTPHTPQAVGGLNKPKRMSNTVEPPRPKRLNATHAMAEISKQINADPQILTPGKLFRFLNVLSRYR